MIGKEISTVWVRWYAELNDYIPADFRFVSCPTSIECSVSIGDIIQKSGIPFSEVDLILADGESVDFSYKPRGGTRISIYPVFESFDISTVTKIRPEPLRASKFVLDVHLGKLAYYLRMLGFDSLYRNDFGDEELLQLSVNERRTLLSRDTALLADERIQRGYHVRAQHPRCQILEVLNRFDLFRSCQPLRRCLRCNVLLEPADAEDVLGRVPHRIADMYHEFRRCPTCGRIYWKGSHYERMMLFAESIIHSKVEASGTEYPSL